MAEGSHPKPNYKAIFFALLVLTVLEVFAANLPFSKTIIMLIMIAFALLKALLVAMFYMHLKFEKVLLTVICVGPLLFSLIFVLLIGFDLQQATP